MLSSDAALVLFSGGQDSTVCLAWALDRFKSVETIGFDYGQRHRVELNCRQAILHEIKKDFPDWGSKLGPDHMIDLSVLGQISSTAMTSDVAIEMNANGLPSTFVPGRNLLFFTFAAAVAYRRGLKNLVGGMCETDFSGYPDCRDDTLKAQQITLNLGMGTDFVLLPPLMRRTKAETWALAHELGGAKFIEKVIHETHTCYLGNRSQFNDWGYGCGSCPACSLRQKGYESWLLHHKA